MRRFIILFLALALGSTLLWHFETKRRGEDEPGGDQPSGEQAPDPAPIDLEPRDTTPEVPAEDPKDAADVTGAAEPGGQGADEPTGDGVEIYAPERHESSGELWARMPRPADDDEGVRSVLHAENKATIDGGTGLRLLKLQVEAFVLTDPVTRKETLRTKILADAAETRVAPGDSRFISLSDDQTALLEQVVVEQLRDTPLAPLTVDADRLKVWYFNERYESIDDDRVTFRSRSVRGGGRGFSASSKDGSLRFERSADVTMILDDGRRASIVAGGDEGTLALDVIERGPGASWPEGARRLRIRADGEVGLTLSTQGVDTASDPADGTVDETPIGLDAESLDVTLEFRRGADRPIIVAARADGKVVMRRDTDVYRGSTAIFGFDGDGNPTSCVLDDAPTLDYRIVDQDGRELRVEVSGAGPLTAIFAPGATQDEGEVDLTFLGPGRVVAVDRGDEVTFQTSLVSSGLTDRSRFDATLKGEVRAAGLLGDLASDEVETTFEAGSGLRVRTGGPTRLSHRPAEGDETYRFRAAGGVLARQTVAGSWIVERAEGVIGEALGADPYRVEAGFARDVDLAKRTLSATEDVLYRTSWGSAFAPSGFVRGLAFVELHGTDEDPVRLDILPPGRALEVDAARIAGVRTGWLRAPSMTMTEETVLAEGGVSSQFEMAESVWGVDAESLLVKRDVAGRAFDAAEAAAKPGEVRALRSEELRVEANFVREARYDAADASGVFRASRLELDAALVDPADVPGLDATGDATLDPQRRLRVHLLGDVNAQLVAHPPLAAGEPLPEGPRPVLQSWDLDAAEADIVRLPAELDADGKPGKAPYSLAADEVTRCHYEGDGRLLDVVAGRIEADGAFQAVMDTTSGEAPDMTGSTFVARDTVSVVYKAAADQPSLKARGHVFVLVDGKRGTLKPEKGKRVRATGITPGDGLPYTLVAKEILFQDERLEAVEAEVELAEPLMFPDLGVELRRVTTGQLIATRDRISFNREVQGFVEGNKGPKADIKVGFMEVDPAGFRKKGDRKSPRALGPNAPVPPRKPLQEDDQETGLPGTFGGPLDIDIEGLVVKSPNVYADPEKGGRLRLQEAEISLPEQGITVEADVLWVDLSALNSGDRKDFLVDAVSLAIRGGKEERPWVLECASLDSKVVGDEVMMTLVAPLITAGADSARADYLSMWVDRAAWGTVGGSLRDPDAVAPPPAVDNAKPNFLAELLFELETQEYARYARAIFMEGGVEIARSDRREAKGSRLYIEVQKAAAWLEDAELVYPLQSKGEEVPLRVRTERFETNEVGALTAKGATLTTCDHDVPHFVVRTRLFTLEPRADGGWRFGARGNRLKFQGGFQLPLPSIGNLVLDDEFGVEGFENEAGEVTPLRDIAVARTARFGTVLGAAFRFDIGDIGGWIAERVGMDVDHLKGKWDTQAQYLGSRGPLVGAGLFLREREPGNDPDEDFRLDAFIGGIPDGGDDRGVVRVPDSERDDLRLFGYVRSRYPIVRGEWVDIAIGTQTDAGVQPEFYEDEFLRFEQRDTFVNWRKEFGADFLSAKIQKRIDDFRSQKEELPSILAYRGERKIGSFTGAPVLWGGSFEAGYFQRRVGESGRDIFSELVLGDDPSAGNAETGRADLRQRLSIPVQTSVPGLKATPFLEARGTAWTNTLSDGEDTARGGVRAGAELSTVLHKVTGDGYLHTLAPRVSASADVVYEETDETLIPLDQLENPYDGTVYEAGLRALWVRPATFENFDLDVRGILRTDREQLFEDSSELGIRGEYITRYGRGVGQVGMRHDARYDMESGETIYSRSAVAVRPSDTFIAEVQYGQARAIDASELYETAGLLTRWRVDPKWEIETRYVHDLQNDQQLFVEGILRRFSHDFVFDISIQDRAGEGSTTVSFNLAPLLGWTRSRLGMLDRR